MPCKNASLVLLISWEIKGNSVERLLVLPQPADITKFDNYI